MINSRIPCGSHKQSMIAWILLTIVIGLFCQVRDTGAVKCFECKANKTDVNQCYLEDKNAVEKDCSLDGCMTYQMSTQENYAFIFGGRLCLNQTYLDCIRSHTGLDMKDARCLKTILKFETFENIGKCIRGDGETRDMDENEKARNVQVSSSTPNIDLRICTCKGDLCNKADIWKPDQFKEENSASRHSQISTAAWLCVTIGMVFFTLCPCQ